MAACGEACVREQHAGSAGSWAQLRRLMNRDDIAAAAAPAKNARRCMHTSPDGKFRKLVRTGRDHLQSHERDVVMIPNSRRVPLERLPNAVLQVRDRVVPTLIQQTHK